MQAVEEAAVLMAEEHMKLLKKEVSTVEAQHQKKVRQPAQAAGGVGCPAIP